MEEFAFESHQRALRAWDEGRFDREVVPYDGVTRRRGPTRATRRSRRWRSLSTLSEGGRMTAAVSSQISDGAAAMLIASEAAVERHGLTPRARFHTQTVVGGDPVLMLTGPIPATQRCSSAPG